LDEEKSKHASLAQQNGLAKLCTYQRREECNKYKLTATPSFGDSDWSIIMIALGGLLLVVSNLFA
jgi:hypothetical protein